MSCIDASTALDLAHGRLPPAQASEVRTHLAVCPTCRERAEAAARSLTVKEVARSGPGEATRGGREGATAGGATAYPEAPKLPRGTSLGRYIVLSPLGEGGMSVVYEAYDPELNRRVAVKLLREAADAPAERKASRRARLLREAQAIAALSHPNVVAVYDAGVFGDQVFVAMERADGQTLRQWLSSAVPLKDVLRVFCEAGAGLATAHAARIVHRDFKPENVLVRSDGRALVIDFGIARTLDDAPRPPAGASPAPLDAYATAHGQVVGTPAYMAPEQHRGQTADDKSDQFSFACTLYEAVAGAHPYPGSTSAEIAAAMERGPPEPPKTVPAWLRQLLRRAMSPQPDRRFESMDALLAQLAKDPVGARRRGAAYAAAGVLVVAVASGAAVVVRDRANLCSGAQDKLEGVWAQRHKDKARAAFAATGVAGAKEIWSRVEQRVEEYARSWTGMHTEACVATRRRGEQSEEVMDLRMGCLDQRLRELSAVTGLYARADPAVVGRAFDLVKALSPLDACADVQQLRATVPEPKDPAARSKLTQVKEGIAQVQALAAAGKVPDALALASAQLTAAAEVGYAPVLGQARLLLGMQQSRMNDPKAEQTLLEAIWAADEGRDDVTSARAWTELLFEVGYNRARYADAHRIARHAEAAVRRAGSSDELYVELYSALGALAYHEQRLKDQLEYAQKQTELIRKTHREEDLELATALQMMGMALVDLGREQEAVTAHEKVLEIRERLLPPGHHQIAVAHGNLCTSLYEPGLLKESLTHAKKAQEIFEKAYGRDHRDAVQAVVAAARSQVGLGQLDEAEAGLRRALAVEEQRGDGHPLIGLVMQGLGDVALARGDLSGALRWQERSLSVWEPKLGPSNPRTARQRARTGELHFRMGRRAQGVAMAEKALADLTQAQSRPRDVAEVRFALGQMLFEVQREPKRAEELVEQAIANFDELHDAKRVEAVKAYLASRKLKN